MMCTHAQVREHAEWHAAQVRIESARQAVIDAAEAWDDAERYTVGGLRSKARRELMRAVRAHKEAKDAAE